VRIPRHPVQSDSTQGVGRCVLPLPARKEEEEVQSDDEGQFVQLWTVPVLHKGDRGAGL
jgi:hypothetical protein